MKEKQETEPDKKVEKPTNKKTKDVIKSKSFLKIFFKLKFQKIKKETKSSQKQTPTKSATTPKPATNASSQSNSSTRSNSTATVPSTPSSVKAQSPSTNSSRFFHTPQANNSLFSNPHLLGGPTNVTPSPILNPLYDSNYPPLSKSPNNQTEFSNHESQNSNNGYIWTQNHSSQSNKSNSSNLLPIQPPNSAVQKQPIGPSPPSSTSVLFSSSPVSKISTSIQGQSLFGQPGLWSSPSPLLNEVFF